MTLRGYGDRDVGIYASPNNWRTCFCVFLYLCMVTDFSAGALRISEKFCTAVRPDLGRFSPILGITQKWPNFEMAKFLAVNRIE